MIKSINKFFYQCVDIDNNWTSPYGVCLTIFNKTNVTPFYVALNTMTKRLPIVLLGDKLSNSFNVKVAG